MRLSMHRTRLARSRMRSADNGRQLEVRDKDEII
ncbi:hypothetical protein L915_01365 [Phytophthora nicotianae]|uniref:Uncharacterized protein n=1 Tax=Phytophthora nicotianae TaxID=4792 RepID=W2JRX8_PHYNI|nr:hypothetical protein L915_01365 [Phytophthora nicotianae]ETL49125.1 hypothetical protein L916_01337 [Phytophthora nicotianae]